MQRSCLAARLVAVALILFCSRDLLAEAPAKAETLPTVDEVLAIHRANAAKLSCLHLKVERREEKTEASAEKDRKEIENLKLALDGLKKMPKDAKLNINGEEISGEELRKRIPEIEAGIKHQIRYFLREAQPWFLVYPQEFFLRGSDYQFRQPVKSAQVNEEFHFDFPPDRPTPENLPSTFADVQIFTYRHDAEIPNTGWVGAKSPFVYLTKSQYGNSVGLPPFTTAIKVDNRGPNVIDAFFAGAPGDYQVVRQEPLDGRTVTVVDAIVPGEGTTKYHCRAWLDLQRGALPLKIRRSQTTLTKLAPFNERSGTEVATIERIQPLAGQAFYPAKGKLEHLGIDPTEPSLTPEQWKEVAQGKRPPPRQVVMRRESWDCSLVEVNPPLAADFFALAMPSNKLHSNLDTHQIIGQKPWGKLVKVGEKPTLEVASWSDGKSRKLEDLQGRVVYVQFVERGSAQPQHMSYLETVAAKFEGRPVTFLFIVVAGAESKREADQVAAITKGWKTPVLTAIDAGTMPFDSATLHRWGMQGANTVVVDAQGTVSYVDPVFDCEGGCCGVDDDAESPGMKQYNDVMSKRFAAVGETWPISTKLSLEEQQKIVGRALSNYMIMEVEKALAKK